MSAHAKWLAQFCEVCDGSGLLTDRHPLNPAARDFMCGPCDGTGIQCEGCREMKNAGDLCEECSLESVEALWESEQRQGLNRPGMRDE
jgi:hypothetical protein